MLVVNFKNYVFGKKLLDLVQKVEIYCNKAIVAVPISEIKDIASGTTAPVYSQHMDYFEQGRGTGYVIGEAIKEKGAQGSIINHSEHKISLAKIRKTIIRANELNLKVIVCSSSLKEVEKLIKLCPFAIAFEDPKLIASGKSITSNKAGEVKKFVKLLHGKKIIPLCGAGISSGDDVQAALQLGCKGVLVSSVIANSPHPDKFLKEIANIF